MTVGGRASDVSILLVEDDPGDALLIRANLAEAGLPETAVTWRQTLAEALIAIDSLAGGPACVLLDLGLPDALGVDAVRRVVGAAADTPVIVLTGRQESDGVTALSSGAQDYLVKDELTPQLLRRSIRYAMERKRAQQTQARLRLSAAEQARLERGLLPTPMLRTQTVACSTYYRPGSDGAVLGGDFFDVIEREDGTVRAVIGDVMGHGPDEAALGVHLRVAWRTLLLAGAPDESVLPTMSRLLLAEQGDTGQFATVCDLTISNATVTVRVAGHPAPVVAGRNGTRYPELEVGPPIGVVGPGGVSLAGWPSNRFEIVADSSILMYTDGLLDAYGASTGTPSLGVEELVAAVDACARSGEPVSAWIPRLVGGAPGESKDDTAAVVLTTRGG